MRRVFFVFLVACVSCFAISNLNAASFDPGSDWQTLETPHFRIHYPKNIEHLAQRSGNILEEIFPKVTAKWSWKPWGFTEVILVDNTDDSNGFSTVIPYNWMLIYAVAPPPDSSLGNYDDWLRMLLLHEFTHIVQLDAYGGAWYPLRILLGKTVAPSGVDPVWMREGMAQYDETIFTDAGRGRGAFSEMVVRTSIYEDDFPTTDEADGLSWKWPSYRTAYVYGLKFTQWLVNKYGEEKFLEFDKRVRKSIMLGMINHQARNVYHKTFYELWREWKKDLQTTYQNQRVEIESRGLTTYEDVATTKRDEQFSAGVLSPDGARLVYTVESPHTKSQIRIKDLASGDVETVRKGQRPVQYSWSPDGKKIAYAVMSGYKRYNRFFDLWLYDSEGNRVKKLTNGLRARDPDFTPDGKSIIFVVEDFGTDSVRRLDLDTNQITTLTEAVVSYTQFANPRVSPDGKYIALSVWKHKHGWRIYRYNIDGTNPARLTKGEGVIIEMKPAWTSDSGQVVFSSDEDGVTNLYRAYVAGGGSEKITNVLSGVFEPAITPSNEVFAQYYTVRGYKIVKLTNIDVNPHPKTLRGVRPPRETGEGSRRVSGGEGVSPSEVVSRGGLTPKQNLKGKKSKSKSITGPATESADFNEDLLDDIKYPTRKYVAFGRSLFLPRFIAPNFAYTNETFFASLTTGGADLLRWHNWSATGNYRADANYFGYTFQYTYNRFRPVFGAMIAAYAVDFGDITFAQVNAAGAIIGYNTVHFYEKRHAYAAFFSYPISRSLFTLAYFYEDHQPKTNLTASEAAALNLGHFAGFRGEFRYGDAENYTAAISPENGRNIKLVGSITNKNLGSASKNEQTIFAGDWREYILLGRHNVFALRAAGGITWGDRFVQGTFGLGGALGEGSFGGGGTYNYFPLRGIPVSALSRTRAMLFSGEYRFPVIAALRGVGTVPLFLKDINGAIFADYGNAWNAHEGGCDKFSTFFDNFLLGVGAELRANIIIGHGLPIHARLGYAIIVKNKGRVAALTDPVTKQSIKYGSLVLSLGTSF